jgi:hypothetical protein
MRCTIELLACSCLDNVRKLPEASAVRVSITRFTDAARSETRRQRWRSCVSCSARSLTCSRNCAS